MVALRKLGWPLLFEGPYVFGLDQPLIWFYELQKDAYTFLLLTSIFWVGRFAARQRLEKEGRREEAKESGRMTLTSGGRIYVVNADEVRLAKSAANYVEIELERRQLLVRMTLSDLERLLMAAGDNHIRIHRSCIVHKSDIEELRPNGDGTASGVVLYVAAEGGFGIKNRLAAIARKRPELAETPFYLLPMRLNLGGEIDHSALAQAVSDLKPSLVVVDTLARTMGDGNENSTQDMNRFVASVDRVRELTGAHTALSAGIALAGLLGVWDKQPRREIVIAARTKDQGRIAFDFVVGFMRTLSVETQAQINIRKAPRLEVEYDGDGGGHIIKVIAADGKSALGMAPTLVLMDERGHWMIEQGDALEASLTSALAKRKGRALIISTSAPNDQHPFSIWLDDGGEGVYVQEHRPPPGLPADDVASLMQANPGAKFGIGPSLEDLQRDARRAIKRGGSALTSFRLYNRNERVSDEHRGVLLTVDEWMDCEVDKLPPKQGQVVIGVDIGGSAAMTAAAFYWPLTGRLETVAAFPSVPSLADRGASDGVSDRYIQMKSRGELICLGQQTVPIQDFMREVMRKVEGEQVACIIADRFKQAELGEAIDALKLRTPVIWRGTGWKDGNEDCERFQRAAYDHEIKSLPSLLLRAAIADAVTLRDPANNMKLTKGRSRGRIDAVQAAVIAVSEDEERREAGLDLENRRSTEWDGLIDQFEMRQVADHYMHQNELSGATAEVVSELRSKGTFQGVPVPWEVLETRAGETVSTATPDPIRTSPIIDRLFPQSVAARMGGSMVNIGTGEMEYPVTTSAVSASWQDGETTDIADPSEYTTTDRPLKPDNTLGIQMVITRKALKQSGSALEQAVRRDMNGAIGEAMDQAVFLGTGANGQPTGLFTGAGAFSITETDVSAAPSYAAFRAAVTRFMTANAAGGPGDVNLLIRPEVFDSMDDDLISGTSVSEWDRLTARVSSVVMSSNALAAPDGSNLCNAMLTTNVGGVPPFFVGTWGAIDLIRDPYTKAKSGALTLTALTTMDVTVSRALQTEVLQNLDLS
eukprot:g2607.t1